MVGGGLLGRRAGTTGRAGGGIISCWPAFVLIWLGSCCRSFALVTLKFNLRSVFLSFEMNQLDPMVAHLLEDDAHVLEALSDSDSDQEADDQWQMMATAAARAMRLVLSR